MFAGMDAFALMIFGLAMGAGAFFAGLAMHGVMAKDGFGPVGNMVILIAGALLGMYVVPMIDLPLAGHAADAVGGVTGGFTALAFLAIVKNYLIKAGF